MFFELFSRYKMLSDEGDGEELIFVNRTRVEEAACGSHTDEFCLCERR